MTAKEKLLEKTDAIFKNEPHEAGWFRDMAHAIDIEAEARCRDAPILRALRSTLRYQHGANQSVQEYYNQIWSVNMNCYLALTDEIRRLDPTDVTLKPLNWWRRPFYHLGAWLVRKSLN